MFVFQYQSSVNNTILLSATSKIEDSAFFALANTLNIVTITLGTAVTEELMANKQFLNFNVVATHPETTSGTTSVLISLPEKICPGRCKISTMWLGKLC